MQDINCRGPFLLSKCAIPHLHAAPNPHILTLAPPVNLARRHVGVSLAASAVQKPFGGDEVMARARKPKIVADAASAIVTRPSRQATGNFYIDEKILAEEGITDLSHYTYGAAGAELLPDIGID
jgi:citronellol/citronellal dehydrogenase